MSLIERKTQNMLVDGCTRCNLHTSITCLHHSHRTREDFSPSKESLDRSKYIEPQLPVKATQPAFSNDIGSRFGLRLRDLRRAKQMTQMDMAVTFGIDRSYISDVECGKKGVSLATLEVIALGLRMELSDLLKNL
jgi:DNA-binding XRE family transcriptional regulator